MAKSLKMKIIKYPEGNEVQIGDVIWTNEGRNVRRVMRILSAEEALEIGENDGPGILWVRNINPYSASDVLGFESEADFSYEGIGKLSLEEMQYVEYLFQVLERQLGKQIWNNHQFLYYPAIYRLNDEFCWFLFCSDSQTRKERCYEYRKDEEKFYVVEDEELCQKIRVL